MRQKADRTCLHHFGIEYYPMRGKLFPIRMKRAELLHFVSGHVILSNVTVVNCIQFYRYILTKPFPRNNVETSLQRGETLLHCSLAMDQGEDSDPGFF